MSNQKRLNEINNILIPAARSVISNKSREINKLEQEAKEIIASTKDLPRVSDHALVRYLERHHGINTDILRSEILTPANVAAIHAGVSKIKVGQLTFVVENNTVVTVISK